MFKKSHAFTKSLLHIFKNYGTMPTHTRYPYIKRLNFKEVDGDHINFFKSIMSPEQVVTDENIIDSYNMDWLKECKGSSKLVLRPKNSKQISDILAYCNKNNLPIVPQGGNTGLVHGSIPVFDEIILSLSLMNKIESINELAGVVVCQAGCILKQLDDYISQYGYIVPLDLGAKGSCQIGGNLSTNAGGIRLLRYGPLRGSVLGLEAVLPDGSILDCMNTMRKDNTGYDLKQLLIGSEGTLGIITKVAIQCQPRPLDMNVAFFGCNSFDTVIQAYTLAKKMLGETISAFEFMDKISTDAVIKQLGYRNPLHQKGGPVPHYPFYFLTECSGSNADHNTAKMTNFISALLQNADPEGLNDPPSLEGVLSNSLREYREIWKMREDIYTALVPLYASLGASLITYDLSLPINQWQNLVVACEKIVSPINGAVSFCGHLGDQNIHVNVKVPSDAMQFEAERHESSSVKKRLDALVYGEFPKTLASPDSYSISAEHGIGLCKQKAFNERSKNYANVKFKIHMMKSIKAMLDPNNILNPYKIFQMQ